MVASTTGRGTFIVDPGEDKYWDRKLLIEQHGAYYRDHHFGNLLAWAPDPVAYDPGLTRRWAGCDDRASGLQPCPDASLHYNEVTDAFSDSHVITALVWGDAFIALACGNFSEVTPTITPPVITGTKFEDVDGDGTRNGNEPGLVNWTIEAWQGGQVVGSATTNGDGDYRLVLDAQRYPIEGEHFELREVDQTGWVASRTPDVVHVPFGSHDAVFSGNDFGNYRPATIEGVKFDDHDIDRVRDSGDGGLPGWTIAMSGGRSADASDITDGTGSYSFGGLIPGTYVVAETQQAHWRQSAPASGTHTVTVRSGDTMTADFGNVCLGSVEVGITEEGTGATISGVEVRIEQISVVGVLANEPELPITTTGTPTFADLLPGSYRVIAFLPPRVYTSDPDLTSVEGRLAVVKVITVSECTATPVPIKLFSTSSGKVTGGMDMKAPGGSANAGFVFMTRKGQAEGSLEFQDRAAGLNLHTKQIEQILVRGNEAWIGGLVEVDGVVHRFSLHLVDNGEPGRDDRFELLLDTGYRYGYDRTIDGGNVQIHPPAY